MSQRDRDATGRPRNARPRDAAGRPRPRGTAGVPGVPDDLALPPAAALREAQRLLDVDRPFAAHEVLESAWKAASPPERALWQGLAQLAVGLTHAQRGNAAGAAALLRRGADRISAYAADAPYRVRVGPLCSAATALAARVESVGLTGVAPADLRWTLTTDPADPADPAG